jgi:AGZA family xanthine/uracil permease-like MFS transporter
MTMSYILLVNPTILHQASTPGDEFPMDALVSSTALTAAFSSLLVGLTANLPFDLMPGMGLNAYFTFGICQVLNVSWRKALSCCFVSGVTLLILSALGTTSWIQRMVPNHLKKAITVAIGLFQALIGFQTMGLVVSSDETLVTLGDVNWNSNPELFIAIGGFLLISTLLASCRVKGAMFIGIWAMAALAWTWGLSDLPKGILGRPSFGTLGLIDFSGWCDVGSSEFWGLFGASAAILAVIIFDVAGVQYGIAMRAHLLDDKEEVPGGKWGFLSVAIGTIFGSYLGTSPVIIANESSAGVLEGARTGLSSVVCAVLFTCSAFMSPLLTSVPRVATSVPLVLVGAFMVAPVSGIDWDDLLVAIPSFVTITVVPFTYSISNGVVAGLLVQLYLDVTSVVLRYFGVAVDINSEAEEVVTPHSPMPPPESMAGGARLLLK